MADLMVESVDVWAASIRDEPGGLAVMLKGLRDAGADLEFIVARRAHEEPGTGVVFVTPLRGDTEIAAAADLGFNVSSQLHAVRVEGENTRGAVAELTDLLAEAGINLRGVSAAVIGTRFILHVAVDSVSDATRAIDILKQARTSVAAWD
jgi:hypothetical protein